MTLLGMEPETWTSAGLLADIVGFGLLTLDVLPEYNRHQTHRALSQAKGLLSHSRWSGFDRLQRVGQVSPQMLNDLENWTNVDVAVRQVETGGLDDEWYDLALRRIDEAARRSHLRPRAFWRGLQTILLGSKRRAPGNWYRGRPSSVRQLVEWLLEVEQHVATRELWYEGRWRGPIWLGIGLIVAGFAAQFVGNL